MTSLDDYDAERLAYFIRRIDTALFGKDFSGYIFVGEDAPYQFKDPVPFVKNIQTEIPPEMFKYVVGRQGGVVGTKHQFLISTTAVFRSGQDFVARRRLGRLDIDLLWCGMAFKRVWVKVLHMAGGPPHDIFPSADILALCCNKDIIARMREQAGVGVHIGDVIQHMLDSEWDEHIKLEYTSLYPNAELYKDWFAMCSAQAEVLSRLAMSVGTIEEGIAFMQRCKVIVDTLSKSRVVL